MTRNFSFSYRLQGEPKIEHLELSPAAADKHRKSLLAKGATRLTVKKVGKSKNDHRRPRRLKHFAD